MTQIKTATNTDTVWVVRWLAEGFVKRFNLESSPQRIDCCDCFDDNLKLKWLGFKIQRTTVYSSPGYYGYEYSYGGLEKVSDFLSDRGKYYDWFEKPWAKHTPILDATEYVVKEIGVD